MHKIVNVVEKLSNFIFDDLLKRLESNEIGQRLIGKHLEFDPEELRRIHVQNSGHEYEDIFTDEFLLWKARLQSTVVGRFLLTIANVASFLEDNIAYYNKHTIQYIIKDKLEDFYLSDYFFPSLAVGIGLIVYFLFF